MARCNFTALVLMIIILLFAPNSAQAHPGRTDAKGGHTCHTNCAKWGLQQEQYHFHNGGTTTQTPAPPPSSPPKTESVTPPPPPAPTPPADPIVNPPEEDIEEVTVSWGGNTEQDLKNYNIYVNGAVVKTLPAQEHQFTITGLTGGQTYKIQIAAVNQAGLSTMSPTVTATPKVKPQPGAEMMEQINNNVTEAKKVAVVEAKSNESNKQESSSIGGVLGFAAVGFVGYVLYRRGKKR